MQNNIEDTEIDFPLTLESKHARSNEYARCIK